MAPRGPSAAFTPISPDLDLAALVEETPNFEYVTRVSCEMVDQQSVDAFEKLVLLHVIIGGKPLVIDGFQNKLDDWTFSSQWLQDNCGSKFEQARNLTKKSNMPLSIGHYLNNMSKLTDQWTSQNYKEPDRQRIYLKDIDCPKLWYDKLELQIPASIFYLNESTGDKGGPGARDASSKGIARSGDLMSCLPPEMRAENMMCYIGHEGTYTPAHREMCASLGHNIMVESSTTKDRGRPTKPGTSIWFMTETKDRHLVSEYWLSTLGHDIEVEKHFAQIAAWKHAPFTTYVVEQKAGDFILIPPLAPHQVWNRGTRTMKVAWNRTTVETLEMALNEALPRARMVCRDEQYKNKAIVYFTLRKYSGLLKDVELQMRMEQNPLVRESLMYSTKIKQLEKDFKRLFTLYTEILLSEMLVQVSPSEKRGQYIPFEGFITCSYCRCNIFNRFLTCTTCTEPLSNGDEDTYDICMDCFAMGRSCKCISAYKWAEQFPWQDLMKDHEDWRQQIIEFDGGAAGAGVNDKTPKSFSAERKALQKKTLAQVCQEQLKIRPWSDPNNPLLPLTFAQKRDIARSPGSSGTGDEDAENGNSKKKAKRTDNMDKNFDVEHVSLYPEARWKLATCTNCSRSYSYGSLWRMFDLMPLTVMEDPAWKCPFCLRICSCGACRKKGGMKPYEPKGTVLGHDTKIVADRRSMEHLVDFSHSNIRWIKAVGDDDPNESRRLSRRIEEAEIAKSQDVTLDNEKYIDQVDDDELFLGNGDQDLPVDATIDPALLTADGRNAALAARPAAASSGKKQTSAAAGLGLSSSEKSQDHSTSFVSNGITYEYPDPTETQTLPFNNNTANEAQQPNNKKSTRKSKAQRKAELNLIQPDVEVGEGGKEVPDMLSDKDTTSLKRKRTKQAEEDESEFRIRQQRTTTTTNTTRNNGPARQSYAEAADNSSSEDDDLTANDIINATTTSATTNKPLHPRPLPGYLARRNQKLPKPSTPTSPSRTPRGRPPKNRPSFQPNTNKNNDNNKNLSTADQIAEANHLAKLKAVRWADPSTAAQADDGNDSSSSSSSSRAEVVTNPPAQKNRAAHKKKPVEKAGKDGAGRKPMAVPMSMLERKRMLGKKVRIGSAKTAAAVK